MSDPQTPEGEIPSESPASGMTLFEEELVIDTELVESGRVRLIKRVEVETVTRTIELRREVLEVEQLDPAGDQEPGAGPPEGAPLREVRGGAFTSGSFREGTLEIVLMQEEAVITTRRVPRETVRIRKSTTTQERTVETELRSERADLEQGQ